VTVEVLTCEQGSPEWAKARAGIPTASEFATVLAKGKSGGESVTRRKYLLKLAGEILTGEVEEGYSNVHTERGHALEPAARDLYAFMRNAEPELVGFIRNDDKGCSPDSLIGADGMLEIKTALPSILLDKLLRAEFPAEHVAQTQGSLWVAEREWIDIAIYWPKLPLFTKRAFRDEAFIKHLAAAVARFNEELAETVERIRSYSDPPGSALKKQLMESLVA
jgi:hypothetical protein